MSTDAGVVGGLTAPLLCSASDQRLVEHVRAGSHRAFETLFDRHHLAILGFCAHMLGSPEDAEDAAQQTFLVAYRALVRTAEPVALRPWLYGIARHRCLVALRGRRERPTAQVGEPGSSYDLAAEVGMRDDLRAVFADVARLPEEQRAALVLAELGDLSHKEIARVVGCRPGKIKALVFQARASLGAARAARETPCAEIREQLTILRGPALSRAALRRHLNDCPSCRAYRDAVRSGRRRLGARLPWAPIIALKRHVVGAASGSGSGAGGSALAGGALGGGGLAAAALVTVAISASGGTDRVTAVRDGEAPVRVVAHAGPVTRLAQRAEQAPAAHAPSRKAPHASLIGDNDPGGAGGDMGVTEADPQPAPKEAAGDEQHEPVVDDASAAPVSDPRQQDPAQPPRSWSPASLSAPDSGSASVPALTSPERRPTRPPPRASSGASNAPPTEPRGLRHPATPSRPANDHPQPATPTRPANDHPQPATPTRPADDHPRPAARAADPNPPQAPAVPSAATSPGESDSRGSSGAKPDPGNR